MKYRGQIEIVARGVCVRNGHALLCRPAKGGYRYLPGGHVEFNESAPVALEREIEEELGLASRAGAFLGAMENTYRRKGERSCELNLFFRLSVPSLRPPRAPVAVEAQVAFDWVRLADLGGADLLPAPLCTLVPRWARRPQGHRAAWHSTYPRAGERAR